jgi:hypothetical protein
MFKPTVRDLGEERYVRRVDHVMFQEDAAATLAALRSAVAATLHWHLRWLIPQADTLTRPYCSHGTEKQTDKDRSCQLQVIIMHYY